MNIFRKLFPQPATQNEFRKSMNKMVRIYSVIFPDRAGYTFFSVTIWEGHLEVADPETSLGWYHSVRILEGRYVLFGKIVHHINICVGTDREWENIIKYAIDTTTEWGASMKMFLDEYAAMREERPHASIGIDSENHLKYFE